MLKRKAIDDLIKWKEIDTRRPMLITGAKGVGKTYLTYDFSRAFFKDICYLNFEREPSLKELINNKDFSAIQVQLMSHINQVNVAGDAILIMDEVTLSYQLIALLSMHKLQEMFPYVILITSESIHHELGECFDRLTIFPFDFDEFLRATNNEWYIELIVNHFQTNSKIPDIVHKELMELHHIFLRIGGMPGAINEYMSLSTMINIPEQHNTLIGSYHDTITRVFAESDAFRMKQVLNSLVTQLMKENRKFQYKLIRKGTTHSMYKEAIRKLSDIYYIIKCNRVSNDQLLAVNGVLNHIDLYDDNISNFKLYLSDTGLLYSKILEENGLCDHSMYQKVIMENYVAQSLLANHHAVAFWESESMAKVDFIIPTKDKFIPIEIHGTQNTRSKSISILRQKFDFDYAIKISPNNFEFSNRIKYVPYYAVFCI